ncbi:hypothetical protein [Magnetospira sp. QH-2]|uniref:hypothetical protein n=1 Tax=Magnetospira sp. (strain QH-2) TaxID=1288970 RepID=UPI0003E813D8|nr:hypothetical protein [Magnetospira sp. QH-2]CCQ73000.1 Magnetosome protein MamR [Magnetospira sp. QH-2]
MIWRSLTRGGILLSVISEAARLWDMASRDIRPARIYSSAEAAKLLGTDRKSVLLLIKENAMKAKQIKGNYQILGQNIIDYLNK